MTPLSDRDFAQIRASVLATIERRRARRAFAIRAAGLTLSLIVVFALAMRMATRDDEIVAPVRHAHLMNVAPPPSAAPLVRTPPRAAAPHHKRHHEQTQPQPQTQTPIRLELATADPDVRIIWISTGETR